jgi:hypothetical protein
MRRLYRASAAFRARAVAWLLVVGWVVFLPRTAPAQYWPGHAKDPLHDAFTTTASLVPSHIRWSTPVDLDPQYSSGGVLYVHYGSPVITALNNVLVPQKTGATGNFVVNAFAASTGKQIWTLSTDYVLPAHNWTPPMGITLSGGDKHVVIPGAGGTILSRTAPNSSQGVVTRLAFYGIKNYNQNPTAFSSAIQICTPITCDGTQTVYFGYVSSGAALPGYPNGIPSGLAKVSLSGTGSFVSAASLCGDTSIKKPAYNCAPALTTNNSKLYIAVNVSNFSYGYLCAVNTSNLTASSSVRLRDPRSASEDAAVPDDGTAAPTIGPDGDVYYGVLEYNFPSNHARGWMLHYNSTLSTVKTPGAFGWDDSASIVPSNLVPQYTGKSTYLLLTKYNNYSDPGIGGNGQNKVAILDPNGTETDPVTGATVMHEIITVLGPTKNPTLNGVDEWCINSAAIDGSSPGNGRAIINSEDGHVYTWYFNNNSLSTGLKLANPTGEAYTMTLIGPDGAVYAINNAVLNCCDAGSGTKAQNHADTPILPFAPRARPSLGPLSLAGGLVAAMVLASLLAFRAARHFRSAPGGVLSRFGVS